MKLSELMEVLQDGATCFSILPYCEEYENGVENLKREPWYKEIEDRPVERIVTIGGGSYPVETCINLAQENEIQKACPHLASGVYLENLAEQIGISREGRTDEQLRQYFLETYRKMNMLTIEGAILHCEARTIADCLKCAVAKNGTVCSMKLSFT